MPQPPARPGPPESTPCSWPSSHPSGPLSPLATQRPVTRRWPPPSRRLSDRWPSRSSRARCGAPATDSLFFNREETERQWLATFPVFSRLHPAPAGLLGLRSLAKEQRRPTTGRRGRPARARLRPMARSKSLRAGHSSRKAPRKTPMPCLAGIFGTVERAGGTGTNSTERQWARRADRSLRLGLRLLCTGPNACSTVATHHIIAADPPVNIRR